MRIVELYRRETPTFSFEFFPPKTEAGYRTLYRTIADLKELAPGFVSVTWGAGGSTRKRTLDLVAEIQTSLGIPAVAHLTCIGMTRAEFGEILDALQEAGLGNVLALRGDAPRDQPNYHPPADGFRYASELTAFIRAHGGFCIGGACYPETHPEAPDAETDLARLVQKVESGAEFLITQLFFDNADFFAFEARARAAGIDVPIIPGIMPVTSAANVARMASLCGAKIPEALGRALAGAAEDPQHTLMIGVEWATAQCRELVARGAPGIHFYTLNRSPATRLVVRNLFPR